MIPYTGILTDRQYDMVQQWKSLGYEIEVREEELLRVYASKDNRTALLFVMPKTTIKEEK